VHCHLVERESGLPSAQPLRLDFLVQVAQDLHREGHDQTIALQIVNFRLDLLGLLACVFTYREYFGQQILRPHLVSFNSKSGFFVLQLSLVHDFDFVFVLSSFGRN